MTAPRRKPAPPAAALYEQDFHAWAMDQARLVRALGPGRIDRENVAEELESLGEQKRSEIESRLAQLLCHLLKARHQPGKWKGGWQATITVQRREIKKVVRRNLSLKGYPASVLAEEYETARQMATAETDLPLATFPEACPFTIEEILDDAFTGLPADGRGRGPTP